MPTEPQIDATFILYISPITETAGIERGITITVETLQGHQAHSICQLQAKTVDGGQGTIAIDCRLTIEGETMVNIAVIGTGIQEVRALGVVLTVEYGGVRTQPSVEMSIDGIGTKMQAIAIIAQTASHGRILQVVFLRHLCFRAMVARGHNGGCSAVLVQCCIHRAIRGEGGERQSLAETDGGAHPLQIVCLRARRMGTERRCRTSQILQHRHLALRETAVENQPHPQRRPIPTQHQRFHATHLLQLQIGRVVIIAPSVLACEKGFPSILRPNKPQLQIIAIRKLIAQPVTVGRPQIAFAVSLALVER